MIAYGNHIAAAIATGVFAVFVWALRGHFASASVPLGMWLVSAVSICTLVAFLAGLAKMTPPLLLLSVGTVAHLGALTFFAAAFRCTRERRITLAFDPDPPSFLVRDGIYSRLRHPFYTSYILFWAGCCIQVPAPGLLAGAAALSALYVCAALAEERKFAASSLADDYQSYRREAGFLWPKLLRSRP